MHACVYVYIPTGREWTWHNCRSTMCSHENTVTVLRPLPRTRRGVVSYQWKYDPKQIYYHLRGPAGLAHSSDLNNGNMNFHVQNRAGGVCVCGMCEDQVGEGEGACIMVLWTYLCFCLCFSRSLMLPGSLWQKILGLQTLTSNRLLTKQQVWIWYVYVSWREMSLN